MQEIHTICGVKDDEPTWVFDDASFEKMGALMSDNFCRLLGFYDMSAFLIQINLYRGRGLSDSHELSLFLQLYNAHPWRRDTGETINVMYPWDLCFYTAYKPREFVNKYYLSLFGGGEGELISISNIRGEDLRGNSNTPLPPLNF